MASFNKMVENGKKKNRKICRDAAYSLIKAINNPDGELKDALYDELVTQNLQQIEIYDYTNEPQYVEKYLHGLKKIINQRSDFHILMSPVCNNYIVDKIKDIDTKSNTNMKTSIGVEFHRKKLIIEYQKPEKNTEKIYVKYNAVDLDTYPKLLNLNNNGLVDALSQVEQCQMIDSVTKSDDSTPYLPHHYYKFRCPIEKNVVANYKSSNNLVFSKHPFPQQI